jgi:alpha-tubulin suppressor-like RCC1 family protein
VATIDVTASPGATKVVGNTLYGYFVQSNALSLSGPDWTWGDGTANSTGEVAVKAWYTPGNYTVNVTTAATDRTPNAPLSASFAVSAIGSPLSLGSNHSCGILADGNVKCWGTTNNGVSDLNALTDTVSVAATFDANCALKKDATVTCWGSNAAWQGGLGSNSVGRIPATLVPGLTGVTAIGAAYEAYCALLADKTVKCWGNNGTLGNQLPFASTSVPSPTLIPGLTDVASLGMGQEGHSCVVKTNGTVACWGNNGRGQLGDGTTVTPRTSPVAVPGLTNVAAVSANGQSTCALKYDGSVSCWGSNFYYQLGNGTGLNSSTPVSVTGLTDAVALSLGREHACALKEDGTVACWGRSVFGNLGDGFVGNGREPAIVSGLTNIVAIASSSSSYSCALKNTGETFCWGQSSSGALGDGTTTQRNSPVLVNAGAVFWK